MAIAEEQMTHVKPSIRRDMEPGPQRERELKTTAEFVTSGSIAESVGAAGTVVLAILGLAGIFPTYMAPIAAIALGGAFLLQGSAIAARYGRLLSETGRGALSEAELGGGMTTEFIGGAAGVVLGILALLNLVPATLLAVAAIVFGGTLLLGSGVPARLNVLASQPPMHNTVRMLVRETVYATAGAQALVGAGAVVLGILSLVGFVPATLNLVAMLAVGGAAFLAGSALCGRMMFLFRRRNP
jgi:hypothetical protein